MDLAPYLPVLRLVHVLGVLAFVLVHGASAMVAMRVRGERDPIRIRALLELSSAYQGWGWIALLMTPIPTAYLNDVRHAVGMATYDDTRKKLEPLAPVSDEELARVLDSNRPNIGAVIGLGGLAILVWLMMFKPF